MLRPISSGQNNEKPKENIFTFFSHLFSFLRIRARQVIIFTYIFFVFLAEIIFDLKTWSIRRMFWGRSSFYRSSFHIIISIVTIGALLSGVSTRLNILSASETQGLDLSAGLIGRQDLFSQSGTAESISTISEDEVDYRIFRHKVQEGESLSGISELYGISSNSIRWANQLANDSIKTGQVLRIPEIDGAFVKVKAGDTLETIAAKNNGNVADIIDLNSSVIDYRNPVLTPGMEVFIPGGEIPLPTPTRRVFAFSQPRVNTPPVNTRIEIPSGSFIHPLLNCGGWQWSRGYSSWHRGSDMARNGGCWINAAASGTVIKAQWGSGGEGNHVVIDHGNGVWTRYYHGAKNYAVKVGDYVSAGQSILYMGNTGYSFGTHLHFEIVINGVRVNPEYYLKLR